MNINEIAHMAGVSRATVSRYLNDGYVSAEKRKVIKRVIDSTGYVPSSRAQTLRTGRTQLVGVIIPKISSESISREVAGLTMALSAENYQVVLANTENDEKAEIRYLRVFAEKQVDGIILTGTIFTPEHFKAMSELTVPVVVLGQCLEKHSCVYFDDYHSMFDVVSLVTKTSSHLAFLGVTEKDVAAGHMRRKAFHDACDAAGIDRADTLDLTVAFSMEAGCKATRTLMAEHPETDAICCATDNIAAGCMAALHELGRLVPDDVQVTGMGDSMLSQVVMPTLTTAHLFYRTSGTEAARMLVSMMHNETDVRREVKMGYEVVRRGSTR